MNQHGSQTVQAAQQDVRDTNGERWDTQSPQCELVSYGLRESDETGLDAWPPLTLEKSVPV